MTVRTIGVELRSVKPRASRGTNRRRAVAVVATASNVEVKHRSGAKTLRHGAKPKTSARAVRDSATAHNAAMSATTVINALGIVRRRAAMTEQKTSAESAEMAAVSRQPSVVARNLASV
jgi:hypothetical protein